MEMRSEVVVFNGVSYYRYPDSPHRHLRVYFQAGRIGSLHRAVWEHHYGPIPKGHHVHHEGDPLDNSIENLRLMDASAHARLHWGRRKPRDRRCTQCGATFFSVRGLQADAYCSNKCKAAFRRASGVDDEARECRVCLNEFIANKYAKSEHCSRGCAVVTSANKRRGVSQPKRGVALTKVPPKEE